MRFPITADLMSQLLFNDSCVRSSPCHVESPLPPTHASASRTPHRRWSSYFLPVREAAFDQVGNICCRVYLTLHNESLVPNPSSRMPRPRPCFALLELFIASQPDATNSSNWSNPAGIGLHILRCRCAVNNMSVAVPYVAPVVTVHCVVNVIPIMLFLCYLSINLTRNINYLSKADSRYKTTCSFDSVRLFRI